MTSVPKLMIVALLVLSPTTAVSDQAEPVGPFKRQTGITAPRTVALWADHFSIGSVQTSVGAGHALVGLVSEPISTGHMLKITLETKANHGKQLTLHMDATGANAYSLGAFAVGIEAESHEAGHTDLSSALGPLYLPFVGLDYLIAGQGGDPAEQWANMDARSYDQYSTTVPTLVGAGFFKSDQDGKVVPFLALRFNIDERVNEKSTKERDLMVGMRRLQKIYEWLNSQILIPQVIDKGRPLPVFFEFDLLRKKQLLSTDFNSVSGPDWLKFEIDTETNYGHANHRPGSCDLRYDAIAWRPMVGLAAQITPAVEGYLRGGGSVAASGRVDLAGTNDRPIGLGTSLEAEGGLAIFDYATFRARLKKSSFYDGKFTGEWAFATGVTNEYRSPKNLLPGWMNYMDFSIEYMKESLEGLPNQRVKIDRLNLWLGERW